MKRDLRLGAILALALAALFVLAETALLSMVQTPAYGNDPRTNFPGHAR